jgi:hypothetical protein
VLHSSLVRSIAALSIACTLLPGEARAQEVLVEKDFELGDFPSDWLMYGTIPIQWRISSPGDCGLPSRMAAFNHGSTCTYFATFSTAGQLSTSTFDIPDGRSLRVAFDYALEIDLLPDLFEVRLESNDGSVGAVLLVDAYGLTNDGSLQHADLVLPTPAAFYGTDARVTFWISGDTLGNSGLGLMLDNVRVSLDPVGRPICFGDASGVACPCANLGATGEGCANSTGSGSTLTTAGSALVGSDDLQLIAMQARPNTARLLVQGASQVTVPFKDGLLCAGNPTERLEITHLDAAGSATSSGSIVTAGAVAPGDTRVYQLWYRDPSVSPCGTGSNLSSAVLVQWN